MNIFILGESPSNTRPPGMEDIPFSGKTSYILWDELKKYNIYRKDVYVTNVVIGRINYKPTQELIEKNLPRVLKEINQQKPIAIMPMGNIPCSALIKDFSGIMDNIGKIYFLEESNNRNKIIIPCIHPCAIARNPLRKKDFQKCIFTAIEVINLITKMEGYYASQ
jgi:uracil-DNA glycosylase family 4